MAWRQGSFVHRFCRLVLPSGNGRLPSPDDCDTVERLDAILAALHPTQRFLSRALLWAVNLLAVVRGYGLPLGWLSEERARQYLGGLERSRIFWFRTLFTGAKAIVMTAYYSDPAVERLTGYRDDCLGSSR